MNENLSAQFNINAERIKRGTFPVFMESVKNKKVLILADETTKKFCAPVKTMLPTANLFIIPEEEPVADEKTVELVKEQATGYDYILAVGSGTLNDLAKFVGFNLGVKSGVFATAPSMDGFTSGVTPLIIDGKKVTVSAQTASDVLIDDEVLASAPKKMIGAGVGDILAKYCCLTDWRISTYLNGEAYNEESANLMYEAVKACDESIPLLIEGKAEGAKNLMDALLISGYAMVIAGNSRPASGAEHHMSHFLEMDFLRRGERIPLHGIKVGLGTLVSLYLYHTLSRRPKFNGAEYVYGEAEKLPSVEKVEETLRALNCPTRFSELGIPKETIRKMFFEAYKIRERFTILTLYNTYGFMEDTVDELMERFY